MEFEHNIIKFFQAGLTPGWITFFQIITLFGSFLGLFICFVILFFRDKRLSVVLIIVFIAGSIINHFLKAIICRARPFDSFTDIINWGNEDGYSMPSGHSLCAGIFATFLIYAILKYQKGKLTKALGCISCILFAGLIALSRMILGVHFLTDTILGITLGFLFAILGIMLYTLVLKKTT